MQKTTHRKGLEGAATGLTIALFLPSANNKMKFRQSRRPTNLVISEARIQIPQVNSTLCLSKLARNILMQG